MVRIKSAGPPKQAKMSALVDITDNSRDNDPNSPVSSVAGNPLRQMRTLQRLWPFQKRTNMKRLGPLSSYFICKTLLRGNVFRNVGHGKLKEMLDDGLETKQTLRTERTHPSQ